MCMSGDRGIANLRVVSVTHALFSPLTIKSRVIRVPWRRILLLHSNFAPLAAVAE